MIHDFDELDVFACDLDGMTLIEASAGTGKTWNICALYVRLLLERALEADGILVVTFTKAATAELRERIRARLATLVHVLEEDQAQRGMIDLSDPFIARVLEVSIDAGVGRDNALLRLRRALRGFDQAAIHTIHAFCQRALSEAPFASGTPFDFEMQTDDADLRLALAVDFWRTHVEPKAAEAADFAAWLVRLKASPVVLDAQLSRRLKKPLALIRWDDAGQGAVDTAVAAIDALPMLYAEAAEVWHAQRDALQALLSASLVVLNGATYKPASIATAMADWDAYINGGDCHAGLGAKAELLTASVLVRRTKKDKTTPVHPFFDLADEIVAASSRAGALNAGRWRALLETWLAWAARELPLRKRASRTLSFDDLLSHLHRALVTQPWLAEAIRRRYPAALIDEFQDTDPVQFDIFRRIYRGSQGNQGNQGGREDRAEHYGDDAVGGDRIYSDDADGIDGGDGSDGDDGSDGSDSSDRSDGGGSSAPTDSAPSLFLVGDPKQAIYGFRAADLHTYLAAREQADARYTLAVNQRSTAPVIGAGNAIFARHARAFILDGLDYRPVRAGERARAPFVDRAGAGDDVNAAAGLHVWLLPGSDDESPSEEPAKARTGNEGDADDAADGEPLRKSEAMRLAAQASAVEIVRLLRGARDGQVTLGERPLAGSDIAVLVQTHRQGALVKRALGALGVAAVELAQASVFSTPEAELLERMLLAVDAPGDLRRIRAALAGDWLGFDARVLSRLDAAYQPSIDAWPEEADSAIDSVAGRASDPVVDAMADIDPLAGEDAMQWVERFTRYRTLWVERGFAVMWRALSHDLSISRRLAGREEGERRLTNLGHLAELVHAYAIEQNGLTPVLRWLATQRVTHGGGEEAQLRLESDRDLVQIVTIHKSKGLEYAIVFCPFLLDGAQRPFTRGKLPDAVEYHDPEGHAIIDYRDDDAMIDDALADLRLEQSAERARLIYVALTRAVYRTYLIAGMYGSGAHASTREARQSVLNWLVAGNVSNDSSDYAAWSAKPPEASAILHAWRTLGERAMGGVISVSPIDAHPQAVPLGREHDGVTRYHAQTARRVVRERWRLASFSSLIAGGSVSGIGGETSESHDGARAGDARPDHDEWADVVDEAALGGRWNGAVLPRADDDILDFPRGPLAGDCLHRLFELADLAQPASWDGAIVRALRERPPGGAVRTDVAGRWPAMMRRLLDNVARSEVQPGMRLAMVPSSKRLTELGFMFSTGTLSAAALSRTMAQHGYPALPVDARGLSGYMRGFIDVVLQHDGRFWVIDWKSNFLGEAPDDYVGASLRQAMASHGYDLQALIYIVALHRYLRRRLPGYDYDQHVAGSLYLFIRGVRTDWLATSGAAAQIPGVHADRPPRALIEALDRLMGMTADGGVR
jgi:exodeoxyribonuclease V beta subunit